tara:strand:+ start:550 stop:678 length:129 start_codon:yes stop_codon:yes gene_type:complete
MDAAFCSEALKEAVASKTEPMKIAAQEQTLVHLKKMAKWLHK